MYLFSLVTSCLRQTRHNQTVEGLPHAPVLMLEKHPLNYVPREVEQFERTGLISV